MTVWDKIYGVLLNSLKTGGYTRIVKLTGIQIGVQAATYASGNVFGINNPIEIEIVRSKNSTGVIQSVVTIDLSNQSGAYDIFFFDSHPTGNYVDQNAFALTDTDALKCIGTISVVGGNYVSTSSVAIGITKNIGLTIQSLSGNKIWVIYVSRDTKTYALNELSNCIGIFQD